SHPFGRRGMASDDALAQGQGRKRWFGGRGPTRAAEKSPESDMTPGQPPIPETSVQTEGAPDVRPDDEIRVEPEATAPAIPAPPPEALASLRARGGEQSDEEVQLPVVISIAN